MDSMPSYVRILIDIVIIIALAATSVYVYREYGDAIKAWFIEDDRVVVFIENLAVSVTIADDAEERAQGLSGVPMLEELEGKFLIFAEEGYHRFWMIVMLFPIDIIFIDETFTVVDIVENVLPETYPTTYTSRAPARFVLETNAFFARSFSVEVGDRVIVPPRYLPDDLKQNLQ